MKKILYIDPQKTIYPILNKAFIGAIAKDLTETLKLIKENSFDSVFIFDEGLNIEQILKVFSNRNPLYTIILFTKNDELISKYLRNFVDLIIKVPFVEAEIDKISDYFYQKEILTECDLVGRSEEILEIGEFIHNISPVDVTVLIFGESGVGKELVARAIHKISKRKNGPFIPVNCGAIPETIIESELFGHEKGAFTGAIDLHKGYFEQANNGTIFLDEISELTLSAQVKLLRILEWRNFTRVGGTNQIMTDFRLIAATNKDLKKAVMDGKFREDLYFRIAGASIFIPPLRDRQKDIPILTFKFINELSKQQNKVFNGFSNDALELIMKYHWPGNVRELKNFVEKVAILSGGRIIHKEDIQLYFEEHQNFGRPLIAKYDGTIPNQIFYENIQKLFDDNKNIHIKLNELEMKMDNYLLNNLNTKEMEKYNIEQALFQTNGNKVKASKLLGFSTKTLYRKMKKYGIPLK